MARLGGIQQTLSWDLYTDVNTKLGTSHRFAIVLDDQKASKSATPDAFIVRSSPGMKYWRAFPQGPNYSAIQGLDINSGEFTDHKKLTDATKKLLEAQIVLSYPH
jgi:hypothetical protein